MALKHVCVWKDGGWKKATPKDFSDKINVNSRMLMCELCGQYVTLSMGEKQVPHFRHSRGEETKLCEERSKASDENFRWLESKILPPQELPLRICVSEPTFHFEIGFVTLPKFFQGKISSAGLKIKSESQNEKTFLTERLYENSTTWLDVGSFPEKSYSIELTPNNEEVFSFWSNKVLGVNENGTLFDGASGRKLLTDSDVRIGKQYYLMLDTENYSKSSDVELRRICSKNFLGKIWNLYEIGEIRKLSESAAKFFLQFRCRLTNDPIDIQPLWPIHTTTPHLICHESSQLSFYFSGNAQIKCFPAAKNSKYQNNLIQILCNDRQQVVVAGRAHPLQYVYLWKGLPQNVTSPPQVRVTDISGKIISAGTNEKLPKKFSLQVQAEFDGYIFVTTRGVLTEKIFLKANALVEVSDLNLGSELKIYQGLDCIWSVKFERRRKISSIADEEIFSRLKCGKGNPISVPHFWGAMTDKLKNFPKVKNWLYQSIRVGNVPEESYKQFQKFIKESITNGRL